MSAPIYSEEKFEDEVCEILKANGWLFDGTLPYQKWSAYDAGCDKRLALFPEDALAWVKEIQSEAWEKFSKNHTKNPEEVFLRRLAEELDLDRPTIRQDTPQLCGTLYVLRKGFKDINATFRMARYEAFGSAGQAAKIKPISMEDMAIRYAKGELKAIVK